MLPIFIVAAGCVYLHCKSLLEAKTGSKQTADKWLADRLKERPVLQALVDRRNWINHGALYRNPNYTLTFVQVEGVDRTTADLVYEAAKNKGSVIWNAGNTFCWIAEDETIEHSVTYWQEKVVSELSEMVRDIEQ